MYKIIASDGKEYGPVSLEQLKQWVAEGRVNAETRLQAEGGSDWKPASEFPEIKVLLTPPAQGTSAPPGIPPLPGLTVTQRTQGLAITSFVLGLLSMLCFGLLTGIPAVICGHIAHKRARNLPARYGGTGFAIAGFVLGYASVFVTLLLAGMLLPALAKAKDRAQSINCANNMKQIGLAFKIWAVDHNDQFPFNVSTNAGGTLELCAPGNDGYDNHSALHMLVLSNELATPKILVCAADSSKQAARGFHQLQPANVTYQVRTGENVNDTNPSEVLARCPIHGTILHCDGSVEQNRRPRR